MSLKVWIDGNLVDQSQAGVGVYDHGLLYGDGVFEGIRVYNGRIFEGPAHLRRLAESALAVRLKMPYTLEQLTEGILATVKANGFTDCYIRLVVTRGEGYLGLNPARCAKPRTFIIADKIDMYSPEMYEKGMAVITSSVIRNHPNAVSPRIKSLNYLNNILARVEAADAGVGEAIMLNHEGNVAEASADNVFIVRDGTVCTPGTADGILEGITRGVVIQLCKRSGIPCFEKTLQRHDLYVADEMFLTGTGAEVIAVTTIDRRTVGAGVVGPVTRKIMQMFHAHVRGE